MQNFRAMTAADNATNSTSSMDTDPVINYERPLMNCLETLIHNEKYTVKKPAGILNTISVPLLTYSSSLESGTVFAATDPGIAFNMPFVPFLERDHKEYKARSPRTRINNATGNSLQYANKEVNFTPTIRAVKLPGIIKPTKKYANVKPMTHINDSLVPKETVEQEYNSNTDSSTNDTIKANHRTIIIKNARYLTQKKVSIGLKTQITAHGSKAVKEQANTNTMYHLNQPFKSMKQYTNTKATAPQIHKNIIFSPGTSKQYTTVSIVANKKIKHNYEVTNTDSLNGSVSANETMENGNENTDSSTFEISLDPNSQTVTYQITPDSLSTFDDSVANTADALLVDSQNDENTPKSELVFVPYSQYTTTAVPDATNAHTGGVSLDYGLPLMNCIGTVFQGNIQSIIKSEDEESYDEEAIDIPLMKCFKTLE